MRVLLSDGSGLTARQAATQLASHGHTVQALSPDPLCLTRFTRWVQRVNRVPPYGADPMRWLDAALDAYRSAGMDVLLPTQEQVAVLSAAAGRVRAAGVRTAVPSFSALARVQDKISAFATLTAAGLPQPPATVLETAGAGRRVGSIPGIPQAADRHGDDRGQPGHRSRGPGPLRRGGRGSGRVHHGRPPGPAARGWAAGHGAVRVRPW